MSVIIYSSFFKSRSPCILVWHWIFIFQLLRATGKPYHPDCFTCVVCGRSLDGIPFTVDATNQIHCIEDFHKYVSLSVSLFISFSLCLFLPLFLSLSLSFSVFLSLFLSSVHGRWSTCISIPTGLILIKFDRCHLS